MNFSIGSKEDDIISKYKQIAEESNGKVDSEHLMQLTDSYVQLQKSLLRLMRIGDKNESRLLAISNQLSKEQEKIQGIADRLAKYLPTQIYKSIFSSDGMQEIKTQRKFLTVFFSDIQGFTNISSMLQPESLTIFVNRYFAALSEIAGKYGGTIDKFIGDAMMIFFGDPESNGGAEDALACVRMAVEMQAKMFELNAEWKSEGLEYPFITRIGINTGWCNVGNFGSPDRMAYTIIGGEVNLAARIESKCEPGGVLMSYETYALVKDHVVAEPREVVSLKGILRPVKTYAVNRLLNENDIKDETLEILLPNHEPLRIKSSEMTMPERLALIQELKYVTNKLEGNCND